MNLQGETSAQKHEDSDELNQDKAYVNLVLHNDGM